MSDPQYYTVVRKEVFQFIPECDTILDVGCATGLNLKVLKEMGRCKQTYGLEYVEEVAKQAQQNIDNVLCADVSAADLPYPDKFFDVILCLDVLEHMENPWRAVEKLKRVLKDDGVLIASIPNIAYIPVIIKLIFRRFDYEDSGVMDRTHLRFFTLRSMKQMFQNAGFIVTKVKGTYMLGWKLFLQFLFTFGLGIFLGALQYILVVKKQPK
ncbi:MAG: class I SAM-dependent methyltransferase [Candidatus Kapabacteria bacterium]|nr:class I SAM-dependent methyltransferase [Candidatus Kapabacteria bacterium]